MKALALSSFEPEEIKVLTSDFRITTTESLDHKHSLSVAELLSEAMASEYMDRVAALFETSSKVVAASQFSKRVSFSMIAPSLYAMSICNKGLDFSAENCHIESRFQEKTWLPQVRLNDWTVTQPVGNDRDAWRTQVVHNIFAGNLFKVWQAVSQATKIPIAILWENTAIYVYWLYEKRIGDENNESLRSRIEADFQFLLEAPASLFGLSENPLSRYNTAKCMVTSSEHPVRIRQTCCYYYQVSMNQAYCTSCPRVK